VSHGSGGLHPVDGRFGRLRCTWDAGELGASCSELQLDLRDHNNYHDNTYNYDNCNRHINHGNDDKYYNSDVDINSNEYCNSDMDCNNNPDDDHDQYNNEGASW